MGFVFGLSWTPCIGPTYAAIIALSLDAGADGGSAARGATLALAYSLGLGIPFVLSALLLDRAMGVSRALAHHRRLIAAHRDRPTATHGNVCLLDGSAPRLHRHLPAHRVSLTQNPSPVDALPCDRRGTTASTRIRDVGPIAASGLGKGKVCP